MAQMAQIQEFDLWDFMAGHVRLKKGGSFSVLHINGRDFYFYTEEYANKKERAVEEVLGKLDGTGAGCSPCCQEAQAAHEAQRLIREEAGQPSGQDVEGDPIERLERAES